MSLAKRRVIDRIAAIGAALFQGARRGGVARGPGREGGPPSDEARLRFFVNLVHELRTPLALVDGPLQQLARMPELGAGARDYVGVARQNCLRLMNIAEDLLELARLQRDQVRLDPTEIVLDDWLHTLAAAVAHHPGLGAATIVERLGAAGEAVLADARALERVFLNLVSNAIKFSEGRGEIRIGSGVEGARVGLFVEDQGIGIAPEHQAGIFERFRQIDGSMTRRFGGVGIGLALVKELTEAMGGEVALRSAPGAGSRFTIWLARRTPMPARVLPAMRLQSTEGAREALPFERWLRRPLALAGEPGVLTCAPALAGLAGRPAAAAAQTGDVEPCDAGERPKVVVVEDEAELRWLIERTLSEEFDVFLTADGESGRQAVMREAPDVLLTDWMLPGIDGLTLAEHVRATQASTRIVMITARMDEAERVAALRRGVDDFLSKPFSLAELRARLRNLARVARAERRLRSLNAGLEAANRELAAVRAALIQDEKLKSIGMLSAGLVHEINNPVNFMRTATELLRNEPVVQHSPRASELVETIEQGLSRVGTIIGDLRVFAFRGDDAGGDRRRYFEIGDAVATALRLCTHELGAVEVIRRLEPCRALGIKSQIIQVLVNLLSNAAAATRECGRPGEVRIEAVPADGGVRVRVTDNGPGIDPNIMPRLFEPFVTTKEIGAGLGLGLAMSYAIVRAHGGRMRADSAAGAGTTFEFDLPRTAEPAAS
jgi:signal transduction histidine kinase